MLVILKKKDQSFGLIMMGYNFLNKMKVDVLKRRQNFRSMKILIFNEVTQVNVCEI